MSAQARLLFVAFGAGMLAGALLLAAVLRLPQWAMPLTVINAAVAALLSAFNYRDTRRWMRRSREFERDLDERNDRRWREAMAARTPSVSRFHSDN